MTAGGGFTTPQEHLDAALRWIEAASRSRYRGFVWPADRRSVGAKLHAKAMIVDDDAVLHERQSRTPRSTRTSTRRTHPRRRRRPVDPTALRRPHRQRLADAPLRRGSLQLQRTRCVWRQRSSTSSRPVAVISSPRFHEREVELGGRPADRGRRCHDRRGPVVGLDGQALVDVEQPALVDVRRFDGEHVLVAVVQLRLTPREEARRAARRGRRRRAAPRRRSRPPWASARAGRPAHRPSGSSSRGPGAEPRTPGRRCVVEEPHGPQVGRRVPERVEQRGVALEVVAGQVVDGLADRRLVQPVVRVLAPDVGRGPAVDHRLVGDQGAGVPCRAGGHRCVQAGVQRQREEPGAGDVERVEVLVEGEGGRPAQPSIALRAVLTSARSAVIAGRASSPTVIIRKPAAWRLAASDGVGVDAGHDAVALAAGDHRGERAVERVARVVGLPAGARR